jgi:hypothetical protein
MVWPAGSGRLAANFSERKTLRIIAETQSSERYESSAPLASVLDYRADGNRCWVHALMLGSSDIRRYPAARRDRRIAA